MPGRWLRMCGAALLAALPSIAAAQASDRADRIDRRLDRLSRTQTEALSSRALGPIGVTAPAQDDDSIVFSLAAPFAWTDNAGYEDEDGTSAFHVSPAAQVKAVKTLKRIVLEGRATISSDIYSRAEENNLSFLQARFQLSLPGTGASATTPYVRYQPRAEYSDAVFGKYDSTLHDLSAGVTATVAKLLPVPVAVEAFVLRRESSRAERERWQPGITLSAEGAFRNPALGWLVEQSVQARLFTGGTNDGRNDVYASTYAALNWTPKSAPRLEVTLIEATAEWNDSDAAGRDYFVLNIGAGFTARF
jgi:hypothetical protein